MEDFERKLKLAGFRCRRDRRRADAPPLERYPNGLNRLGDSRIS